MNSTAPSPSPAWTPHPAERRQRVIAHVTSLHRADDGRIAVRECRSAAAAGYDVVLVAPGTMLPECAPVRHWPIAARRGLAQRLFRTLPSIVQAIRRVRPSVVQLHDPELLLLLPWLLWRCDAVVFDMHENLPASLELKHWLHPALRRPVRMLITALEAIAFRFCHVVFAEESYVGLYPSIRRGTVIRNLPRSADLPVRPGKLSNSVVLGYIGAISEARGALDMVRATILLRQSGIPATLTLAGPVSDAFLATLLAEAATGGDGVLTYEGRLPIYEAWKLAGRCTLGLAMLHPHANYVDSLPTKVLEYMGIGVPVIASDFPLYRRVVVDNGAGVCIAPRQPELLAATIADLVRRPDLLAAMGERGRAVVRSQYDWDIDAARLVALYDELCFADEAGAGARRATP